MEAIGGIGQVIGRINDLQATNTANNMRVARVNGYMPLGAVPLGLFYHACFSVAASLLMWLLVRHAAGLIGTP